MTVQRVFIVAGELSGDILGAGLMQELKARHPGIQFRGIGGPRMIAQGLKSRFPLETLSVMGLVEVIKHLPELIGVRRTLRREALEWQPDIMIGIDAPDFTLGLEKQLRRAGVRTAHYVSPSVWAWRQGRIHGIAEAVDGMLTLLPFEAAFYRAHKVPVAFVGHPLADELPLVNDRVAERRALGLAEDALILALLPGSRANEIRFLGETFLATAERLCARYADLHIVMPTASAARHAELTTLLARAPALEGRVTLIEGQSREAMVASDVVLLASGTAALEAMLCHRPMLVAYKMAPTTHWLAKRLVKTRWISLPNLIAQETLVPELIQDAASPEAISDGLATLFDDAEARQALEARFAALHATLQRNASRRAADAVTAIATGQPLDELDESEQEQESLHG